MFHDDAHGDDLAFLVLLRKMTLRQLERFEARYPHHLRRSWRFAAIRVATLRVLRGGKSARPSNPPGVGHAPACPTPTTTTAGDDLDELGAARPFTVS